MAHPTVKYFCIEDGSEYHMLRCWWYKRPRLPDLEGPHPYFDDPNKFTVRFMEQYGGMTPQALDLFSANRPKVILETWTAPDCIFEDRQWGQWTNFGNMILEDVIFIKGTLGETDDLKYIDAEYRYETVTHLCHEGDTLYLPMNLPRDKWSIGTRPRPTPEDIKSHRGLDIKPDIVIGG